MMVIFGGRSSDQSAYHMELDYYSNKVMTVMVIMMIIMMVITRWPATTPSPLPGQPPTSRPPSPLAAGPTPPSPWRTEKY